MELKGNQDLAVFLAEMQNLRVKIEEADKDQKMTDRDFILRVLNKLPVEYENTVELIELDIGNTMSISIHSILDKLVLRYQRILNRKDGGKGKSKDGDGDVALYGGRANVTNVESMVTKVLIARVIRRRIPRTRRIQARKIQTKDKSKAKVNKAKTTMLMSFVTIVRLWVI
jgi:hypothetical protein